MKKQVIHFAPAQAGKVMAMLYFVISLPFVALFAFLPGKSALMMVLFPFFYCLSGFLFTALAAWVYNLVAGWVGGIEYTTVEIEE